MFIGHYGPAVWDAHRADGIRLWHGILAVQFIDIVTMILTLVGVEGRPLAPDMHPLAFDIPYSHSLVGSIVLSLIGAGLYRMLRPNVGAKAALIIGGLVFSHWVLDLLVHRPDMPLYPGGDMMLGLGLWNFAWPAYLLEVFLLGGMVAWWLSVTKGPLWTTISAWIVVAILSFLQFGVMTAPTLAYQETGAVPPPAGTAGAVSALVIFVGLAAIFALLERKRSTDG